MFQVANIVNLSLPKSILISLHSSIKRFMRKFIIGQQELYIKQYFQYFIYIYILLATSITLCINLFVCISACISSALFSPT